MSKCKCTQQICDQCGACSRCKKCRCTPVKRHRTSRRANIGEISYVESPARTPTKKVCIYPSDSTAKKMSSNGNKIWGSKRKSIAPPSTGIRLSRSLKCDVTVCTQWFDVRKVLNIAKDVGKNMPSPSRHQKNTYNQLDSKRARYMVLVYRPYRPVFPQPRSLVHHKLRIT
jgi:hypothetical protein